MRHDLICKIRSDPAFPSPGTKLESAHEYGSSMWAHTVKLNAKLPDGSMKPYFLKVRWYP